MDKPTMLDCVKVKYLPFGRLLIYDQLYIPIGSADLLISQFDIGHRVVSNLDRPVIQTNEQYRSQEAPPAVVCGSIVPAAAAPVITIPLSAPIVRKRPNPTPEAASSSFFQRLTANWDHLSVRRSENGSPNFCANPVKQSNEPIVVALADFCA